MSVCATVCVICVKEGHFFLPKFRYRKRFRGETLSDKEKIEYMCWGIKKTLKKLNICLSVEREKVCLFSHKNYIFFINFDVRKMRGEKEGCVFFEKRIIF